MYDFINSIWNATMPYLVVLATLVAVSFKLLDWLAEEYQNPRLAQISNYLFVIEFIIAIYALVLVVLLAIIGGQWGPLIIGSFFTVWVIREFRERFYGD